MSQPVLKKSTWDAAPETKLDLEWSQLEIVDFSKLATPEGHDELVKTIYRAMTTKGFFFLINHGLPQSKAERLWDISALTFEVPEEEKVKFAEDFAENDSLQGYQLRKKPTDRVENYSVSPNVTKRDHPAALRPFLPEIQEFARFNHFVILDKILRLMSLGLELPEDTLSKVHDFDAVSETYVRFLKCHPRPDDGKPGTDRGHIDSGTLTLLWSQPVITLQIAEPDGRWTWVKHIPNSLVVNAGHMLEFLSGGLYKAALHRVNEPPADLLEYTRYGLFYRSMAPDDLKLVPYADSPVLQRVGITRRFADEDAPTALQWRRFVENNEKWPGFKEN